MKYLRIQCSNPKSECDIWDALPKQIEKLGLDIDCITSVYHREAVDANGDGIKTIKEARERPVVMIPVSGLSDIQVAQLSGWATGVAGVTCDRIVGSMVVPGLVDHRTKRKTTVDS